MQLCYMIRKENWIRNYFMKNGHWLPTLIAACCSCMYRPCYTSNVSCHYINFKEKTSTCRSQVAHMWVTSRLLSGSAGEMGQQV